VRSVGCGLLLLLGIWTGQASGQVPEAPPWRPAPLTDQAQGAASAPSINEARNASRCESTEWARTIAEITAADPERDAEKQIAEGNFSLRGALEAVSVTKLTPGRFSGFLRGVGFTLQKQPAGVQCFLDVRSTEAFPVPDFVENADDLTKWCVRTVAALANDYARQYNGRVIRDLAYPHKDVCAAVQGRWRQRAGSRPAAQRSADA
jgi:hypothetical protein